MEQREILSLVKAHAGLRSAREAERAVRATLGAMACALDDVDVRALAKALPERLGRSLVRRTGPRVVGLDAFYAEAELRERVGLGFAREHTQTVLEVIAGILDPELVARIRRHLPADLAALLRPRTPAPEPPPHVHTHPAHGSRPLQTLSRSRPGTAEPIAEAAHVLAHAGSVVRSPAAHGERMVETAQSTRPAREDETLATAREDRRR
jgi:uncharacterized protein (DUF2267 family)